MSTHEAPQFGGHLPGDVIKDVVLPTEIDWDWCNQFTAEHATGRSHVVLEADMFLAPKFSPTDYGPGQVLRYHYYHLNVDPVSKSAVLQGKLVDARMIPEYDREKEHLGDYPYLALTGVVQTHPRSDESGEPISLDISENDFERIFIPLDEAKSLLVVDEEYLADPLEVE